MRFYHRINFPVTCFNFFIHRCWTLADANPVLYLTSAGFSVATAPLLLRVPTAQVATNPFCQPIPEDRYSHD
jgi:hypothetical protein